MKRITMTSKLLPALLLLMVLVGCQKHQTPDYNFATTDLSQEHMIPYPLKVIPSGEAFALDQYSAIYIGEDAEGFEAVGNYLAQKILSKTNLQIPVNDYNLERVDRGIYFIQENDDQLKGAEAYTLNILKDSVVIRANSAEGAFRGIQTLRQIIPENSIDSLAAYPIWALPGGTINDAPNFEYRGSMLDVARHFFSVSDVKRYLDLLAYYKINVLHLHLTDDQGWRIEIKSWPKLTEIGGSTEVGGESGGFFTQEDYKEIVNYAKERFITIIPEVDMPGHTNAASVSYPFLNGNGKTPKLYEGTRVGFSTFDTRKDSVYAFIDDVVREIAAISPGPYFHIGGDESHVTEKDDYIYFVNRVEKIVQKYGKRMIGWDEVATADVDSTSIAQFWASEENAEAAYAKGMKVIMSPAKKAYLDMQYDTLSQYGLHWAAYIPVDTAYIWSPERYAKAIPKEQILGVEAPLWSETISNIDELEYLAFPRVIGYSELSWSNEEHRDWEKFKVRLANQAPFLDRMNVKFYRSPRIDWVKSKYSYSTIPKD